MRGNTPRAIGSIAALAAGLGLALPAVAGPPAAIVENVDAPGAGIRFMDYVEPGQVIDLGKKGVLSLGYLRSCLRDTITGGRVIVGEERSRVEGGKLVRERVECDGGKINMTSGQAGKSAVLVLRAPPAGAAGALPRPSFKIYGTSPVFKPAAGTREVVIERLDRPEDNIAVAVSGGIVDLSAKGKQLDPGGLYRASAGERAVVFAVDPFAESGASPIVGRFVPF